MFYTCQICGERVMILDQAEHMIEKHLPTETDVYNVGDKFRWTGVLAWNDDGPCTVTKVDVKFYGLEDRISYEYDDHKGEVYQNNSQTLRENTQKIS